MSDIENPISTDKSSVFDYKQYEANELNYWYLSEDKKLCEEAEAKIQSVKVRQVVVPDISTLEKIKVFQKSKNLEQTGKIGPKTRMALWRIQHELDD